MAEINGVSSGFLQLSCDAGNSASAVTMRRQRRGQNARRGSRLVTYYIPEVSDEPDDSFFVDAGNNHNSGCDKLVS